MLLRSNWYRSDKPCQPVEESSRNREEAVVPQVIPLLTTP